MKIKVNLAQLIEQAAPQVWGSDERARLYDWLGRNTSEQIVTLDLRAAGARRLIRRPRHRPCKSK